MKILRFLFRRFHFNVFFILFLFLSGCDHRVNVNDFYYGRQNFLNQNYAVAKRQLMGPAIIGNPEAQYAIGYMYVYGLGGPADEKMGLKWIKRSAASGYYPAQEALQILWPQGIQEKSGRFLFNGNPQPLPLQ